MEITDLRPLVGGIAGFFPQFPLNGGETVLVRGVQLAGGDLQDDPVQRVAVLPFHDHFVVFRDGDDADRADMADDFPDGGAPVGKGDPVPLHMENDAVENILGGDGFFGEAGELGRNVKIHNSLFIIHNEILRIRRSIKAGSV